jgi:hypothetical protein
MPGVIILVFVAVLARLGYPPELAPGVVMAALAAAIRSQAALLPAV